MRIGVLTGGGDAPGLNAAIRGVARRALQLGHRVSGIQNGWAGALQGDIDELAPEDVRGILHLGGTILGTSRTNPLKEPDGVKRVMANLKRFGVEGLVAIGGDDTLSVAAAMHEAGALVVGVPKTIDNDLSVTDFCIGFDTAVGVVVEALDRLHTTASAHHRVMVVEVMGRDTGWVAMMGGLAEYSSMLLGFQYVVLVAILFYALSAIGLRRADDTVLESTWTKPFNEPAVAGGSIKPRVQRSETLGAGDKII